MSLTLTGRLTVVYDSDADYSDFLVTVNTDSHLTLVSDDSVTRTIVFDVNIAGT